MKLYKILLLGVIVIAAFFRFYQLGNNPPSLDWDEASIGYNAYSILKTGKDEYGNFLPLSFRSFDDYKPPAYFYLTVPGIYVFGLNEFSIRLPSALFGTLTVLLTFLLVYELFKKINLALLSSFFLAISPWHLQFSRTAFESNLSLFFFVLGFYLFLRGLRKKGYLIFSTIALAAAFYSYHSLRLFIPVFFLGVLYFFKEDILKLKKYFLLFFILGLFLILPIAITSKNGTTSRFSSVTVLTPIGTLDKSINQLEIDKKNNDLLGQFFHNRRFVYAFTVIKGYFDHWNIDFLFIHGDGVQRHHATDMGMLYFFELPFILIGIYQLTKKRTKKTLIIFWWFLVAPIASSLTTGTPHPVRALMFLPTFQIFTAEGVISFFEFIKNKKFYKLVDSAMVIIFVLNFIYYSHQYYVTTPIQTSKNWQYGSKKLFEHLKIEENKYDKIFITYRYDQPYIFYLFYNKIDPSWYQKNWNYLGEGKMERERRVIGKYEFKNIDFDNDSKIKRALIIGTPSEVPRGRAIKEIKFLDGSVAFRIAQS